jgi:hypothetical protein
LAKEPSADKDSHDPENNYIGKSIRDQSEHNNHQLRMVTKHQDKQPREMDMTEHSIHSRPKAFKFNLKLQQAVFYIHNLQFFMLWTNFKFK